MPEAGRCNLLVMFLTILHTPVRLLLAPITVWDGHSRAALAPAWIYQGEKIKKKEIWAPHEQWLLLFALVSNDVVVQLRSLFLAIRVNLHKTRAPVWHLLPLLKGPGLTPSLFTSSPSLPIVAAVQSCSLAPALSLLGCEEEKNKHQCGLGSTSFCKKKNIFLFSKTSGLNLLLYLLTVKILDYSCSVKLLWLKTCFFIS